jgi:hypothetical protein
LSINHIVEFRSSASFSSRRPPSVLLGDRRVDFKSWFPGSFEEGNADRPGRPTGESDPDFTELFGERPGSKPGEVPGDP